MSCVSCSILLVENSFFFVYYLWISYPQLFMVVLAFWNTFLAKVAQQESPVLAQITSQAFPEPPMSGVCILNCSPGVFMYLETKKTRLEEILSSVLKSPHTIRFEIKNTPPAKRKKRVEETPLPLAAFEQKKETSVAAAGLSPQLTFENFAVSSSNQIAHAGAIAVARNPGISYNPLFIYGGVGVGKTHLSQAIAHQVLSQDPTRRVFFCTSEEFTNDLVELIREKNTNHFRKKYRDLDLLIVDDVQFIAGKNYVQEEFYHTFNAIIKKGGQIVLVSDRPPGEIKKLEDRLRSRFAGGLAIDIQKPDFELRTAILLIKAKARNIDIDFQTAQVIAQKTADARELEGQLLRIYTHSLDHGGVITPQDAGKEIEKRAATQVAKITPAEVIRVICSYYNVSPATLKKPGRKESIVLPRQVAMYILRIHLKLNLDDIAYMLKRKDHTTVIHATDKITNLMLTNPNFKEEVDRITQSLSL